MTLQLPAFATDQVYPFWIMRKLLASLASPGVVSPGDMLVTPSSGLQVQIAAGSAYVQQTVNVEAPSNSFYNGLYELFNDAPANPFNTITAPITNSRIDQVILRAYDVQEQGLGGSSKAQFEWLIGSENVLASLSTMGPGLSNPGAAALPANSLGLAWVLQTVGEGTIPSTNIVNAPNRSIAVPPSGSRGSTNISASQSTSSSSYTTLTTPDQVTGIVLPTNGIIRIGYQATWQESVSGAALAAIFLGSNQIRTSTAGALGTVQAGIGGTAAQAVPLSSCSGGLESTPGSSGYAGDATTGQVIAANNINGGFCEIFAAAGTYTVSVQFKASSGSVTASNRKLWVQALSFA